MTVTSAPSYLTPVKSPFAAVPRSRSGRTEERPPSPQARCRAWEIAATIPDPEIPVVTIEDLGILRSVTQDDRGRVHVQITPTYSGCPAMDTIRHDIIEALYDAGFNEVCVEHVLAPAWSTDDITARGRQRLMEYGIAPPAPAGQAAGPVHLTLGAVCPQCGSTQVRESSRFGSTACKSLWICRSCREPFDYFKPL